MEAGFKLKVVTGAGHCDNCERVKDLIILNSYSGHVGMCLECLFPVMKEMNEVAKRLNTEVSET